MNNKIKTKILCVEDEKDIRENIAEILRDEGFEVIEAENGKIGFDKFKEESPDLIISDIMMPEMDGYEFLKLVRNSSGLNNNVPFIILSALGQKDNLIKGINLLANDYLIKPVDFDLMITKIKEKTTNANKVKNVYQSNIKNIKNQVSVALPSEVFSYLDIISQVSSILKEQPYGPLPHRRYLEDINKIYINSLKIRSAITNALDESVIDSRLNANEEIFTIHSFLDELINNLDKKIRNRVEFEKYPETNSLPRLKIEYSVLREGIDKMLYNLFKLDSIKVNIRILIDHLDQMILIFYIENESTIDLSKQIEETKINKILDKQHCRIEIPVGKENSIILTIPSYKLA